MLARREYSKAELCRRLSSTGVSSEILETVLGGLAKEGALSDFRFAEHLVHGRVERGYGPTRIHHELQQHGLDEALIEACLKAYSGGWQARAKAARRKRFGDQPPTNLRERARQVRFLVYRGFTQEQIDAVFRDSDTG